MCEKYRVLFVLFGFSAFTALGATYYVSPSGSHAPPFSHWASAANDIQSAVDAALSGDTVLVADGVYAAGSTVTPGYACMNRVVIDKAITVQSVNGPDATFIVGAEATSGGNGSDAVRCLYMSTGILSGFTVTNGHTMTDLSIHSYNSSGGGINMYGGGVVTNCTLTGNSAEYDGGGSYYGTLNNCIISDNSSLEGGGSYSGTLNNCTLSDNSARYYGGGSYYGTLNNCVLSGNTAFIWGGGSFRGTLNNCTLTGNLAYQEGGGIYQGILNNCIVYLNTAGLSGDNWCFYSEFYNSCTTPIPIFGANNITNNPILISASHIHADSPCVGAGSASYTSGTDIDGEAWATPPSMGCDEPLSPFNGVLDVSLSAEYTQVVKGHELDFSAEIHGEFASNRWTFGDGLSLSNTLCGVRHAWSVAGDYAVVLTAWSDDHPSGVSATVLVHVIDASDYYVDAGNSAQSPPYKTWGTAAISIQNAVNAATATAGSTVWVNDGVYDKGATVTPGYACMNRVVITRDIMVRSVNGPDATFIVGAEAISGGNGSDAVRCLYMSAGTLSGFTVTNGHTMTGYGVDAKGGGVNMYGGHGVVTNCTLTGSSADKDGGGSYYGTLNNCTLSGNLAYGLGGGTCYSVLNHCTLSNNEARDSYIGGGGSYVSILNHCTLSGNVALKNGGGSHSGTLNNCTLSDNSAGYQGGGSYYGTLNNCTLADNSAGYQGGGNYSGSLNNCMLLGNSAGYDGGGSYSGTLINCTLTGNSAERDGGGGMYDGSAYNCISWNNTPDNIDLSYCRYSCSPDLTHGSNGNITTRPRFIGSGNYRLAKTSSCINAGLNGYVDVFTDLDGHPRIVDGTVDMGAYESGFEGFFITNCVPSSTETIVEWTAFPMWTATVKWSTNLVAMPFADLSGSLAYPVNSFTDTVHTAAGECFYRMEMAQEGF